MRGLSELPGLMLKMWDGKEIREWSTRRLAEEREMAVLSYSVACILQYLQIEVMLEVLSSAACAQKRMEGVGELWEGIEGVGSVKFQPGPLAEELAAGWQHHGASTNSAEYKDTYLCISLSLSFILSYGRTTLSDWLPVLLKKNGSRKEHQN
jgi:hypothetical protein